MKAESVDKLDPGDEGSMGFSEILLVGEMLECVGEVNDNVERELCMVGPAELASRSRKDTHWSVMVSLSPNVSSFTLGIPRV